MIHCRSWTKEHHDFLRKPQNQRYPTEDTEGEGPGLARPYLHFTMMFCQSHATPPRGEKQRFAVAVIEVCCPHVPDAPPAA